MPKKVALITGISGQDGSYLSELLLKKIRSSRNQKIFFIQYRENRSSFDNKDFHLHYGDVTDSLSLYDLIKLLNQMKFII